MGEKASGALARTLGTLPKVGYCFVRNKFIASLAKGRWQSHGD